MVIEVIPNLPFAEYQQRDGINTSILKVAYNESLLHAKAVLDGRRKMESDNLDFGKCFHSWTLERKEDWVTKPVTYPAPLKHAKVKKGLIKEGDPLPWNANAAFCKEWEEAQEGIVLSESGTAAVKGMARTLREDPVIGPMLDGAGQSELSVFVEKDGVKRKCRIDRLPSKGPVLDLKSTKNAHPERFLQSAIDLGYDIQAAHTLSILRAAGDPRDEMWFCAIESENPYAYSILKFKDIPGSFLRAGRIKVNAAMLKIQAAMKSGIWPGYPSGEAEEFAKDWMKKELDQTL